MRFVKLRSDQALSEVVYAVRDGDDQLVLDARCKDAVFVTFDAIREILTVAAAKFFARLGLLDNGK